MRWKLNDLSHACQPAPRLLMMLVAAAAPCATLYAGPGKDTPVQVIVDMDADTPGIQSTVTVPACTAVVHEVAVYIIDPLHERTLWSIGYVGGLDRGIALGHMPDDDLNSGSVTGLRATIGTPVNPGNVGWTVQPPGLDPGFVGPELQYLEFGAEAPAVIPAEPAGPIFTVDIMLDGAQPGDRFRFYLLDFVAAWRSGRDIGAFSTHGPGVTLDTGGDAVPDATHTIFGADPDTAIPVPPASFLVDYIDGPPATGPAVIEVVPATGDLNGNGAVNILDLLLLLAAWGPCETPCPPDFDGDGNVGILDLLILLANWGSCP